MALADLNTLDLAALLDELAPPDELDRLLRIARDEDLRERGDVTTASLPRDERSVVADLVARSAGALAGLRLVEPVLRVFESNVQATFLKDDGDVVCPGEVAVTLVGVAADILVLERTLLNLLGHLSGIATCTRAFVGRIAGTRAVICETRKTLPGLRGLQKYAVRCGGGTLHRVGLHDAALYKDNHLATLPSATWATALAEAIIRVRAAGPLRFVEVEVDRLEQLDALLELEPGLIDLILLDNMPPELLRDAVARRDHRSSAIRLEASGGITLDSVRATAEAGVDRISVGALTHSAPGFDLGLDFAE